MTEAYISELMLNITSLSGLARKGTISAYLLDIPKARFQLAVDGNSSGSWPVNGPLALCLRQINAT
jgi:hypothetical protein